MRFQEKISRDFINGRRDFRTRAMKLVSIFTISRAYSAMSREMQLQIFAHRHGREMVFISLTLSLYIA